MIKVEILKWLRHKVSNLGEYCNNNPYNKAAYGLYLSLVDLAY